MSEKTLIEKMRSWEPDPQNDRRTKTAKLKALMPGIEVMLERGATHAEIVEKLNADGFEINKPTFQSCLRRIRKKEQGEPPHKAVQPALAHEGVSPSRSESEMLGINSTRAALGASKKKTEGINYAKLMRDHNRANKEKP